MKTTAQQATARRYTAECEDQKPTTQTMLSQVLCALKNTGIDPDKLDAMSKLRLVREVNARR